MIKQKKTVFNCNVNPGTRIMDETATAARFLLGGIGTGNISVDARGRLTDVEWWNRPNKGFHPPYTFFAVRAEDGEHPAQAKMLAGPHEPLFVYQEGGATTDVEGLSCFRHSRMTGEYPFVYVKLEDEEMPIEAELEAFTPFIPLDADDSSLPGAVLRYRVRNTGARPLRVSVAGSFCNLCRFERYNDWKRPEFGGASVNTYVEESLLRGIRFTPADRTESDADYLESAFLTTEKDATHLTYWNEGSWWDGLQDFWNDFTRDGELSGERPGHDGAKLRQNDPRVASLCVKKEIPAGETAAFEFLITWCRPNRYHCWRQAPHLLPKPAGGLPLLRNYYAKFGGPLKVARYLAEHLESLESQSRLFRRTLFGGSYPPEVIDAVASNLTVLRSPTCFRVEDGTFFAWEGCMDRIGSCEGNCTHVWNYAQTLAFLFPELERSMRRTEFLTETDERGCMSFRACRYLENRVGDPLPAADGQMGCVIRAYRDWRFSGDDAFLKELWPKIRLCLDFARRQWDEDGDGLLDGKQHNTYDIQFYGPNSMINSIYIAALRAGEKMADYLGDKAAAAEYGENARKASALLDAKTFNGEYYIQKLGDVNAVKYQYGDGCLSDQLFGQELAHINGLGYLLPKEHVRSAVRAVYRHNFKKSLRGHHCVQRTYAVNDEAGLLLCTWPNGGRPDYPFVYSDEVWTGIEYQVASHLIYEGFVEEGLNLVRAVRARQDGVRRSPWDEVECGHHYARSLASYGLLLALSGLQVDLPHGTISFRPAAAGDFRTFFSWGTGWGEFFRETDAAGKQSCGYRVLYGALPGGVHVYLTDGETGKAEEVLPAERAR